MFLSVNSCCYCTLSHLESTLPTLVSGVYLQKALWCCKGECTHTCVCVRLHSGEPRKTLISRLGNAANIWWFEHVIYLLLPQTCFKYSHAALQINHLSIFCRTSAGGEERGGCSVGNFVRSLQRFTPHQFHFSIFETPRRAHSHEAGCRLREELGVERFHQALSLTRGPCRLTPPFLPMAPALPSNTLASEGLVSWSWLNLDQCLGLQKGGSVVKRITQNSPMRWLPYSMPVLFIYPSIYRPLFCSLLLPSPSECLSLSVLTPVKTILSFCRMFSPPIPLCTSPASHLGFNPGFRQKRKKKLPLRKAIKPTFFFQLSSG